MDVAIDEFIKRFGTKTGVYWDRRHGMVAQKGESCLIHCDRIFTVYLN